MAHWVCLYEIKSYHFWANFAILGIMDEYFLALAVLIIFSIAAVLAVRISAKNASTDGKADKFKAGADFTILE